jgi:hypothetical protein
VKRLGERADASLFLHLFVNELAVPLNTEGAIGKAVRRSGCMWAAHLFSGCAEQAMGRLTQHRAPFTCRLVGDCCRVCKRDHIAYATTRIVNAVDALVIQQNRIFGAFAADQFCEVYYFLLGDMSPYIWSPAETQASTFAVSDRYIRHDRYIITAVISAMPHLTTAAPVHLIWDEASPWTTVMTSHVW